MEKQTTKKAREELRDWLLGECVADHVGLWKALWATEDHLSPDDPKEATLEVLAELLKAGYIHAGFPKGRLAFEPWDLTPEEAIARIRREWDALGGRDPDIAKIVWFDATEKGRTFAKKLGPQPRAIDKAQPPRNL